MPDQVCIPGTTIEKPELRLAGEDGNAYVILGRVVLALREVGCPKEVIEEFRSKAMAGDYDNLLVVCMQYVRSI